MIEIEVMAVKGGCCGIIQDRLIRNLDREDISQDGSGFPGRYGERYIKGQDEAEDILGIMNLREVNNRSFRC